MRGRYVDRKYAMCVMTKGEEHDERKEVREGAAFSPSHWRHWQSVERRRRACSSRLSQPEGGREGEKAVAALGVGSLGMRSSELEGGWVVGGGPGLG